MGLNEIKSKINDKTKLTYGVIVLILGIIILALLGLKFLFSVILIALPAILLVIPNDNIKNNKIIAVILCIWLIINLLGYIIGIIDPYSFFDSNYDFITAGYQFSGNDMYYFSEIDMLESYTFFACCIMAIYTLINIFGALLFFVPTVKENSGSNFKITNSKDKNYDKYCRECGHGVFKDSKFCPGCGTELLVQNPPEENNSSSNIEDDADKYCFECGHEIYEYSEFCPNCGIKLNHQDESEDK